VKFKWQRLAKYFAYGVLATGTARLSQHLLNQFVHLKRVRADSHFMKVVRDPARLVRKSSNSLIFITGVRTCTVVSIRGFLTVCRWRIF
jgi:hypothetical protein